MEDSVAQLGAFVVATAPKPPPAPDYPGYDPVFKKHYPLFYKVCAPWTLSRALPAPSAPEHPCPSIRARASVPEHPQRTERGRRLLPPASQSLTTGFKPNEGYSYLDKDAPQLFGSLNQVWHSARARSHHRVCVCSSTCVCSRTGCASVRSPSARKTDTRTGLHASRSASLLLWRHTKNHGEERVGPKRFCVVHRAYIWCLGRRHVSLRCVQYQYGRDLCVCACVLVYENVDKETMYRAAHCLPCFPL